MSGKGETKPKIPKSYHLVYAAGGSLLFLMGAGIILTLLFPHLLLIEIPVFSKYIGGVLVGSGGIGLLGKSALDWWNRKKQIVQMSPEELKERDTERERLEETIRDLKKQNKQLLIAKGKLETILTSGEDKTKGLTEEVTQLKRMVELKDELLSKAESYNKTRDDRQKEVAKELEEKYKRTKEMLVTHLPKISSPLVKVTLDDAFPEGIDKPLIEKYRNELFPTKCIKDKQKADHFKITIDPFINSICKTTDEIDTMIRSQQQAPAHWDAYVRSFQEKVATFIDQTNRFFACIFRGLGSSNIPPEVVQKKACELKEKLEENQRALTEKSTREVHDLKDTLLSRQLPFWTPTKQGRKPVEEDTSSTSSSDDDSQPPTPD